MKWALLLLFITSCFSSALPTNDVNAQAFNDPIEIKKIVTTCDQDKDGELNSNEFSNCVSFFNILKNLVKYSKFWYLNQDFPKVRNLDINGDGRVEKHEIKQMVQLTSPTVERDRAAYLAEIGKFKDMVKDCDQDRFPNAGGRSGDNEIGFDEGIECLQKYVRSSAIILILVPDPNFTFSLTTKKCLKNVTKTRMADWYVKSSKIT